MFQQLSHRADDMRNVEIACGYLVQHWSKEKKVFAVDERYFDIRVAC